MNGDGASNNDLIYIPRNASEMNFAAFTGPHGRTYSIADQVAAFEAYIEQDTYLSEHRGEYAERNGLFLPIVKRLDLSISQDIFRSVSGQSPPGADPAGHHQPRQPVQSQLGRRTAPRRAVDLVVSQPDPDPDQPDRGRDREGELPDGGREQHAADDDLSDHHVRGQTGTAGNDVYMMMLSFRYNFN